MTDYLNSSLQILRQKNIIPFSYQRDAINWICHQYINRQSGIIGDTMGLGKTIEMCLGLYVIRPKMTLLVSPKNLQNHWYYSIHKYFTQNNLFIRSGLYYQEITDISEYSFKLKTKKYSSDELNQLSLSSPVVIFSTYDSVKPPYSKKQLKDEYGKNLDDYHLSNPQTLYEYKEKYTPFHGIEFDIIILDECHNIRNGCDNFNEYTSKHQLSSRFANLMRVKLRNSNGVKGVKFLLTGTPIQNRITDLKSLYVFMGLIQYTYIFDENDPNFTYYISNYLFRRTEKNLNIILFDYVGFPKQKYNEEIIQVQYETEDERILYENISTSVHKEGGVAYEFYLNSKIYKIRPFDKREGLLRNNYLLYLSAGIDFFINSYNSNRSNDYYPQLPQWTGNNSKHKMMVKKLYELSLKNESVIIFHEYIDEMESIIKYIENFEPEDKSYWDEKFRGDLGYFYMYINGTVDTKIRSKLIEKSKEIINNGYRCVLFASTSTCREGINLQHFNNIIFADGNYNPGVEAQAIARVYRIGQKKQVNIYRYIHSSFDGKTDGGIQRNIQHVDQKKEDIKSEKIELFKKVFSIPNAAYYFTNSDIDQYVIDEFIRRYPTYSFESIKSIIFGSYEETKSSFDEIEVDDEVDDEEA
jgi:SNF2 family DNA or RNA helicase